MLACSLSQCSGAHGDGQSTEKMGAVQPAEGVSNLKLCGQFPSIKMGNPESTKETKDS